MNEETKNLLNKMAESIMFLKEKTGLAINSPEFKLLIKIDLEKRRFYFSEAAFDFLYRNKPDFQSYAASVADRPGRYSSDALGAHFLFHNDNGILPEKLNIDEFIEAAQSGVLNQISRALKNGLPITITLPETNTPAAVEIEPNSPIGLLFEEIKPATDNPKPEPQPTEEVKPAATNETSPISTLNEELKSSK